MFTAGVVYPLTTMLTSLLLVTTSWATPLDFDRKPHIVEDIGPLLARQAQAPFNVAGVQGGGVKQRLEIRQLQQTGDQWNIFLLGLARMQAADQQDPLSYYQIAGIHGRPLIPWQGVQSFSSSPDSGYCTHHSNLFPTWHRPYLALFEQILQQYATDAANEFPAGATRNKYVAAATSLRLPYWDWAMAPPSGQSTFPPALTTPTQQVITPNGTRIISNPLFSYQYHPVIPGDMYWFPLYQWNSTLRWPTDNTSRATSQNNIAAYWMDQQRSQLQQRTYLLLTQYPNYMNFSNEAWIIQANNPSANYDSVESIHDVVHGTIGGNGFGHMSVIDNSAFDPVFWLHHAAVDRIIALWQAVNPNSWVQPQTQTLDTFTYPAGAVEQSTSPLTPFYQGNGVFWTSDSARDLTKFGYTYPELANGASLSSIKSAINTLYGSSSTGSKKRKSGKRDTSTRPAGRYGSPAGWFSWMFGGGTQAATDTSSTPETIWLANIRAQRHGLQGSFFVHIFIGDPGSDPASWATSPNLVGTQTMLSTLSAMPNADAVSTGVVPLTSAIETQFQQGKLKSLSENDVETYLTANLCWKVAMMDGSVIAADLVPGIDIHVVSTQLQPATSVDTFPNRVGGVTAHNRITAGKPGGHGRGSPF